MLSEQEKKKLQERVLRAKEQAKALDEAKRRRANSVPMPGIKFPKSMMNMLKVINSYLEWAV